MAENSAMSSSDYSTVQHGHTPSDASAFRGASSNPLVSALKGVRVVDFTQIAAGPLCTMLLADMGADVIKIEPPSGDIGRTLGPPFIGGESAVFLALNRNKRGLVIDLKTEDGRRDAEALIATADVVIESFRPGVADRLGIGYRAMKARFPDLIYCSISAYGQDGPWSKKPGVDGVLQAVTGLMSITGSDGEPPTKVQAPLADMVTGYHAVIAVLAALNQRIAGSVPAHIDVNLYASALMLQQVPLLGYLTTKELPKRCGSGAPYATPNEAYTTADGYILIAAYQPERWANLCSAIGRPDLQTNVRFATLPDRMRNRAALTRELNEVFARCGTDEWIALLEPVGIICAPVATYDDVAASPQLPAILTTIHHASAGEFVLPGFAIGGAAMSARLPPPRLGEHDDLLADILAEVEDKGALSSGSRSV
ncbi:Crotonobetainyl-CoA:carnitine CoA-transferase CaiB [Bradyrhizobium sp. Rc2d]|uniref:CaiB/BaiF CoA transferase family protein n=1 Tax=Bradyrhizobium sp. Rc2d TaxID=1855321 RepID=UPI0008802261|nr:CoA transferase [Bradyrhizobium sp. Rc2d]SDJ53904.1 Crotonobetainyl-CoA:carnitine CoA-transferase CaiB [Bradyrhizobium sp. Rc2d]